MRIPLTRPRLPALEEYTALLEESWRTRRLSNSGPYVQQLEAQVAGYGGFSYVAATANCDLALTLAIAALGFEVGARALLPSYTFPSTLHALLWNRLAPCFVDVAEGSFCLDPDALAGALERPTALVVATHAFGAACDLDALERLCADAGATLILDGAQAMGTFSAGSHVAGRGTATALSFSATKTMTAGEGGAVVTSDPYLDERMRLLRAYGRHGREEETVALGLNAKLSELHAALGILSLQTLEYEICRREELALRYRKQLTGIDTIRLQSFGVAERPSFTFLAVSLGRHRDGVEQRLADAGIETRRYFRPLHTFDGYRGFAEAPLPVTDKLGREVLCLPLFSEMGEEAVDEIAQEIRDAVAQDFA